VGSVWFPEFRGPCRVFCGFHVPPPEGCVPPPNRFTPQFKRRGRALSVGTNCFRLPSPECGVKRWGDGTFFSQGGFGQVGAVWVPLGLPTRVFSHFKFAPHTNLFANTPAVFVGYLNFRETTPFLFLPSGCGKFSQTPVTACCRLGGEIVFVTNTLGSNPSLLVFFLSFCK